MKRLHSVPLLLTLMMLGVHHAGASTVYGDLNNFDAVNDTGRDCHGFEIEIDDVHSTDITYTYDWNHYGPPKIREDNTDPAHSKVFVRYASTKNPDGTWVAGTFTLIPTAVLTPTDGHFCTDTSNYSYGCEHFGVGFYGSPTAVKYNWLLDDGTGTLVQGPAVNVGTPSFVYYPPAVAVPAQVVAAIPAPVVPIPVGQQFGEPSWVKVIKTISHNINPVALGDLVSADTDGDGKADWQNGEPDEVESEWKLLQINSAANLAKAEEEGLPDDAGDGNEVVTRRYEFYKYAAAADTRDGETGEAMCDTVDPTADPTEPLYLHGVDSTADGTEVTDANGNPYFVRCADQVIVGDYIGAQMAGFDAAAPLGLVDNLQGGELGTPYTPRTVVVGGNSPYTITIAPGSLPPGLSIAGVDGVLSGTPTSGGNFSFTVGATDADSATVSKAYTLQIAGGAVPQYQLSAGKTGSGSGTVSGNGLDCGTTCAVMLDDGTTATLTATPDAGSVFSGWSGACTGSGNCVVTVNADTVVSANLTRQYALTVSKAGSGTGGVTGNGIDCGVTCSVNLDSGTAVTLTATANSGSVFTGWSGDCNGTAACSTTMNAARSVTATFVPSTQLYTLTVTKSGSGTVTSSPKGINCGKTCSKTYAVGTSVTLTAKPARKHAFLRWSGACSGTATSCTVPMLGTKSVSATFN